MVHNVLCVVFMYFVFLSFLHRTDAVTEKEFVAVGSNGDFDTWRPS